MAKKDKFIDGIMPNNKRVTPRVIGVVSEPEGVRKKKNVVKNTTFRTEDIEELKKRHKIAVAEFDKPVGMLGLDGEEQAEKMIEQAEKENKKPKKKKVRKKWSKKRKVITTIVIVLVLLGAIIGAVLVWGNDLISKLTGGRSGIFDAIGSMLSDETVPLKTDSKGRTNILVLGTSGWDMSGSGHDGAFLTDSIMIVSLDQETKDFAMLNLPRDLITKGTCTATGKINEVYWCANQDGKDEAAGAAAAKKAVGEVLGIDFQYYVHMNWGALETIVNDLGGVTVTLDEDIQDDWTNTYIKAGVPVTLNGEQALGLARARHGTENGDFSRGASQQKLLVGIYEKAMSKGMSVTDAIGLFNTLGDNIRTDFNIDGIKTGIKLVSKDFAVDKIRQVPILVGNDEVTYMTYANYNGISYVVPEASSYWDYSLIQKYVAREFSSNAAAREGADILVLNGSGEQGVASAEKKRLENEGFVVKEIDNAPDGEYAEHYTVYVLNDSKPGTKAALEKFYNVAAKEITEVPVGINTAGYDFIVIVGKE